MTNSSLIRQSARERGARSSLALAVLAPAVLAVATVLGCGQDQPPQNLLLITIDTCRADRVGAYGHPGARTANLDQLAERGTLYGRAYAVAPETLPAHVSLMTGRYPPAHGVRINGSYQLPGAAVTLAETFREAGFFTGAVTASAVLDARYGLDQGFEVYDSVVGRAERRAEEVTERALALLPAATDRRIFLWVHYYDPHSPYEPPAELLPVEPAPPESPPLYEAEIAAVDIALGRLLEGLDRAGRGDRLLVAVTGDHGESLGEHGETYHTLFVYDSTIRVPLVLAGPGIPAGTRVSEPVSQIDLFATLLDLFALDARPGLSRVLPGLTSSSPAPDGPPRALYSETLSPRLRFGWSELTAIRTADWLYVDAPQEELYPADDSGPGAINRALDPGPDDLRQLGIMRELLSRTRSDMRGRSLESEGRAQSVEERRALEALGYLQPNADGGADGRRRADPKEMVEVAEALALGNLARSEGRLDLAERLFSWAAAADPTNGGIRYQLGLTMELAGNAEAAFELLREANRLQPGTWEILADLSALAESVGQQEVARRARREALDRTPLPTEVWRLIARARGRRGDLTSAAQAYREILALAPNDPAARRMLERLPPG